jgi:hypothetical protein
VACFVDPWTLKARQSKQNTFEQFTLRGGAKEN